MPAKICDICGERTAMYVCQNCGSSICPVCRVGWFCKKCSPEPGEHELSERLKVGPIPLLGVAIAIIVAGFTLVFIGSNTGTGSGGCFFWPVPFIVTCGVGSDGTLFGGLFFLVFLVVAVAFWLLSMRWARLPS